MAQVLITRKPGRKYQVALSGHDNAFGEIECVVTLPDSLTIDMHGAHMRVAVARAAALNEEFNKALASALHQMAGFRLEGSDLRCTKGTIALAAGNLTHSEPSRQSEAFRIPSLGGTYAWIEE